MGHPQRADAPVKKAAGRIRSRAAKAKRVAREEGRVSRAAHRLRLVAYVRKHMPTSSIRQAHAALHALVDDSPRLRLELAPIPALATFYRWMDLQGEEGEPSIGRFFDEPGRGRRRKELPEDLVRWLQDQILLDLHPSVRLLWEDAKDFALEEGLDAPSLYQIEEFKKGIDLAELSAAAHGSSAAVADAMPKGTIPVRRPHEVWTLDELLSPVYIEAFHPEARRWVSVKPWVILIADNYSAAIIARHVVRPFQNGVAVGYDSVDITGTFFSAALPELAPDVLRPYAGYLPESLRMDKHATHRELRRLTKHHGIHPPNLPALEPWRRGKIERLIGSFKALCYKIRGHERKFIPTDLLDEAPGTTRRRMASTLARESTKIPIPVRKLLSYEAFVAELDLVIQRYNSRTTSARPVSPEVRYHSGLDGARPGSDAVHMLAPAVVTMGRSLVHAGQTYAWEAAGHALKVGEQVMLRVDPLHRGVFTEIDGARYFLPTELEASARRDPATLALHQRERGRVMSDRADAVRRDHQRREIGAMGQAQADFEVSEARRRRSKEVDDPKVLPMTKQATKKKAAKKKAKSESTTARTRHEKDTEQKKPAPAKKQARKPEEPSTPAPRGMAGSFSKKLRFTE